MRTTYRPSQSVLGLTLTIGGLALAVIVGYAERRALDSGATAPLPDVLKWVGLAIAFAGTALFATARRRRRG